MLRYSAPNDLNGLVLDLRGNPGGLLDMAVEIGDEELLVVCPPDHHFPVHSDTVRARTERHRQCEE